MVVAILYIYGKWDGCYIYDVVWCMSSYFAMEVVSILPINIDGEFFIASIKGVISKIALVK